MEDVPVCTRSGRISRRTQNLPDYNINMLSALDDEYTITVKDDEIAYMGVMLTQMSLKAGLKAFGDRGKASALK